MLAAATVCLGACHGVTDFDDLVGRLPLVSFNGEAVPAVVAPLPTVGPDGSSRGQCNVLMTTGLLELRAGGTYTMRLEQRDSCRNTLLNMSVDSGAVRQVGDSLSLRAPDGQELYWAGVLRDQIIVHYTNGTLGFRR